MVHYELSLQHSQYYKLSLITNSVTFVFPVIFVQLVKLVRYLLIFIFNSLR